MKIFMYRNTKNIDAIFHFFLTSIPFLLFPPYSYIKSNIEVLHFIILECGRKNNIKKIIHTSTSEVYGMPLIFPNR